MATEDQYDPIVPDQTILNEVKFAARDFASMADDLLRRLKIEYGDVYNDYATTSQGIMLRDLVAWAYAALIWNLDRTASDTFLGTSRTRAAVERLVENIAYKMRPASASSTPLTLTFPNGTPGNLKMHERWKYNGPNGLSFESYAEVNPGYAIAPGGTYEVSVRQGETRTLTYTSDGTKNQTYRLASIDEDRFLAVRSTEVWVDGKLWAENDFLEYSKTEQYEISYLANPPVIRFGDGSAGNIPPAGSSVVIRFLIIDGKNGNVKSNTIKSSSDPLVIAGETVTFTVNNALGANGGADPEQMESAKRWAPSSFAARGAAITVADYEALTNTFTDPAYGSVAKSYAINPRGSYDDIIFNEMVSDIEDILSDFNNVVSAQEVSLQDSEGILRSQLVLINGGISSLSDLRDNLKSWSGNLDSQTDSLRALTLNAESRASSSAEECAVASGTLASLRTYVEQNVGNTADRDYILEQLDIIIPSVDLAKNDAVTASGSSSSAKGLIDSIFRPNVDNIVNSVEDDGEMDESLSDMSTATSTMDSTMAGMDIVIDAMQGQGRGVYVEITPLLVAMQERIGTIFSDDCLSNFVQVPVLSLDSEGNYTAPSIGLVTGLQRYLNVIKEVTQVVEVIDGSNILIPAVISVKLEVVDGFVPAEVKSQVQKIIVRMLKGRDYNQPLYLSDIYESLTVGVPGIKYVNVEITGPRGLVPEVFDSEGNLIGNKNQVIMLGGLSIKYPNGEEIV